MPIGRDQGDARDPGGISEGAVGFGGLRLGGRGTAVSFKMQSLVRDLNLTDRVTFTGYRTDVPEVLKALDVTLQASLSENLGGTIEGF